MPHTIPHACLAFKDRALVFLKQHTPNAQQIFRLFSLTAIHPFLWENAPMKTVYLFQNQLLCPPCLIAKLYSQQRVSRTAYLDTRPVPLRWAPSTTRLSAEEVLDGLARAEGVDRQEPPRNFPKPIGLAPADPTTCAECFRHLREV